MSKKRLSEVVLTTAQTAAVLGCDPSSLTLWKRAGAPGYLRRDAWEVCALLGWWLENVHRPDAGDETALESKRRFWAARAKREELHVGQLEKRLMPVSVVEQGFSDRAYELARRLQNMSRRIAHRVSGRSKKSLQKVSEIIDGEVRDMMTAYSRDIEIQADLVKR